VSYSSAYDNYVRSYGTCLHVKFLREAPWGFRSLIRKKTSLKLVEFNKVTNVIDPGCVYRHALFDLATSYPSYNFVGINIREEFISATDFTLEGTTIQGDQHVRELDSKSLENFMKSYVFKFILSSCELWRNFSFQDSMYKMLRSIRELLLIIEFIEIFIELHFGKFSKKLGWHLVYAITIGD